MLLKVKLFRSARGQIGNSLLLAPLISEASKAFIPFRFDQSIPIRQAELSQNSPPTYILNKILNWDAHSWPRRLSLILKQEQSIPPAICRLNYFMLPTNLVTNEIAFYCYNIILLGLSWLYIPCLSLFEVFFLTFLYQRSFQTSVDLAWGEETGYSFLGRKPWQSLAWLTITAYPMVSWGKLTSNFPQKWRLDVPYHRKERVRSSTLVLSSSALSSAMSQSLVDAWPV